MTPAHGNAFNATAVQLLTTAERLFAENGIAGVSLRQIAAAAGSSNSSAVHYHFGTKENLVEATFAYRLPQLIERRALLNARLAPGDLRARLEAQLLPVLELAESPNNSYASFVDQLQRNVEWRPLFAAHAEIHQAQEAFLADVRHLLPDIAEPVLTMRAGQVQGLSLTAAADRERANSKQDSVIPFGLFVATLVDGLAGFLAAPVSEETLRLLARSPTTDSLSPASGGEK